MKQYLKSKEVFQLLYTKKDIFGQKGPKNPPTHPPTQEKDGDTEKGKFYTCTHIQVEILYTEKYTFQNK